jgi:hypothetical protein
LVLDVDEMVTVRHLYSEAYGCLMNAHSTLRAGAQHLGRDRGRIADQERAPVFICG